MSTLLLTFPTADAPARLTSLVVDAPQVAGEEAYTAEVPYEKPVPSLLQPKPGLLIFTLIVFGLVAFLLAKFAWGPISTALEDRERGIENSLSQAERALADAKAIQADNEKARREAEAQAQQILRDAREAAERTATEQREATAQRIAELRAQAEADIERQKESALGELRAEVAGLAITAAEKILREKLDEKEQRRLVDQFIDTLPRN
jgi:F-type H+-transporting ATPase subunit b